MSESPFVWQALSPSLPPSLPPSILGCPWVVRLIAEGGAEEEEGHVGQGDGVGVLDDDARGREREGGREGGGRR